MRSPRRLTPPTELGTILAIWAHPDDETYLAAGVMAAARDHGQRVVCVSATAGEHGTDDAEAWAPDRLRRVRGWEAIGAMAVLDIAEHHILGLPDGSLAADDGGAIARVGELIDTVAPDTILTFGPDGMTYHPDHIAVHHWVTTAWLQRGCPGRLLYAAPNAEHLASRRQLYEEWGIYMADRRPIGVPAAELSVHLRLAGAALDRKVTALRAMATQTSALVAALGADGYRAHVAEEWFVDALPPERQQARPENRS